MQAARPRNDRIMSEVCKKCNFVSGSFVTDSLSAVDQGHQDKQAKVVGCVAEEQSTNNRGRSGIEVARGHELAVAVSNARCPTGPIKK